MNLEKIVQPLGMDVSGYQKGILDAIKGSDNLGDAFKKITSNSAIMGGLVVASLGAIVAAGKHGVDEFVDYADEVRNVTQVTGQNAEASSKMIQVLDDLKVTTNDMNTAQKAFTKQGLQMSIETLGKLSDEYRGLSSATEKADFMQKNFGKDWKKWVETMQQGSAELNKMNDAQHGNLILTEQSLKEARLYEKEVDNLTDAWHGFWVELGRNVVHAMTDAEIEQAQLNILIADGNGKIAYAVSHHIALTGAMKATADAARAQAEAQILAGDTASEVTQKMEDEKAAMDALTSKNNEYLSVLSGVTQENQRYRDTEADLVEKQRVLAAEKDKLIAQGYRPEGKAIQDVNDKMAENRKAMLDNAAEHKKWVNAKIADLLLARLSVDGLTDAEVAYYTKFMVDSGQMTKEDAAQTKQIVSGADDKVAAFQDQGDAIKDTKDQLVHLTSNYEEAFRKSLIPVNFTYTVTGHGSFPNPNQKDDTYIAPTGGGGGGVHNKRATGGAVVAGRSYNVAEFNKAEVFTPNQSGRVDQKSNQPVIARIPRQDMRELADTIVEKLLQVA